MRQRALWRSQNVGADSAWAPCWLRQARSANCLSIRSPAVRKSCARWRPRPRAPRLWWCLRDSWNGPRRGPANTANALLFAHSASCVRWPRAGRAMRWRARRCVPTRRNVRRSIRPLAHAQTTPRPRAANAGPPPKRLAKSPMRAGLRPSARVGCRGSVRHAAGRRWPLAPPQTRPARARPDCGR